MNKSINRTHEPSHSMSERERLFFKAKLAEQAERFDDVLSYAHKLAALKIEFTPDERSLLARAFKNTFSACRKSLRTIELLIERAEAENQPALIEKKNRIESELHQLSAGFFQTLTKHLLPHSKNVENIAFYYQLVGDYNRYLAEILQSEASEKYRQHAFIAYKSGCEIALTQLSAINSIRLGLVLNLAKFFYYLANSPDHAIGLISATWKDIMACGEKPDEMALACVELLRKNRELWLNDQKNAGDSNWARL